MILGCPHDAAGFALLQCLLAERLSVLPGVYTHSISNAHIYDNHYDAAREIMRRTHEHPPVKFTAPSGAFHRATQGDGALVDEIFQQLKSQYQPLAPIENLKITVNVY